MSGLRAVRGSAPTSLSGFVVGYVGHDGREHREVLGAAAGVAFELVSPVRTFPVYRGQRNNTGLWFSATIGAHVGFESWLERDHLTLLDFDPLVVGMASQPFWLLWDDGGRRRSHAPDFFVRLADGEPPLRARPVAGPGTPTAAAGRCTFRVRPHMSTTRPPGDNDTSGPDYTTEATR